MLVVPPSDPKRLFIPAPVAADSTRLKKRARQYGNAGSDGHVQLGSFDHAQVKLPRAAAAHLGNFGERDHLVGTEA